MRHPPGASEASLQELQSAISATKDLYAMLGEGQVVQLGSPASSWSAAGSGFAASSPRLAFTGQPPSPVTATDVSRGRQEWVRQPAGLADGVASLGRQREQGQQPASSADATAVTGSRQEPGHQPASLLAEAPVGLERQDTRQQHADGGKLPAAWEDAAAATDSLYALLGGGIIAQADSSSDAQSQDDSLMDSKLPAEPLLDCAVSVERAAAPAHPAQQWEQWEEQELHADLPAQHSVAVQAGTPHEASTQVAFDSSYQLLFDATALQPCIVSQPTPTQSRPHPLQQLGLLQISAGPHAGSTQQAFSSTIGAELLGKGSAKQWLQDVQLQDLFRCDSVKTPCNVKFVLGVSTELGLLTCRMQLECIRHQANKLRFQCSAGSTALARWASGHVARL